MARFSYSSAERLKFYVSYFWYKLILPFEVKSPAFRLWWYELRYTLHKFRDYYYCLAWKSDVDSVSTRFGTYAIRKNTNDAANVSPAFERLDVNYLIKTIQQLLSDRKKVLFLDVGGDIGTYSVAIGNQFKNTDVKTICFEPVPANYEIAKGNIDRNGLQDCVEIVQLALMDRQMDDLPICLNSMAPGSSGIAAEEGEVIHVPADRMDAVLADRVNDFDTVVMKLDVEGAEEMVLTGASALLEQEIDVHLVVEDFVDTSIIGFLEKTGWDFVCKKTDYNSWWVKSSF